MSGLARSWLSPRGWELAPSPSSYAPATKKGSWVWSNRDMDPVPPSLRTWSTMSFVTYWISDSCNVPAWELASSMLAVGLGWKQALPAIAVGHGLIALVMVLNGTIGARLHVAFPVLNRSSFGFGFSYFTVISRVVLACFWFGVQTYTGSECVLQMTRAIWRATDDIPNRLPESAGITTVGMMCYFIYWLIQLPFLLISPHRIRYLFLAKSLIVPAAWIAILIWACVKVPITTSLGERTTTGTGAALSGSALSWAWLSALNSALGNYATLAVNIPDFTRYARHEKAQYIQAILIPVLFTLTGFIGIVVTATGEILYGETLWDPLHLIGKWDNRAAAFFASFTFFLATLATNISANSLSAANDMTVLCPKYINIRRGQVICAVIGGWALCPWEILASAPGFLSFMGGYTVFLGPFVGIMIGDYWIVHRGKVDLRAMYDPHGRYSYWNGINWRALVAMLLTSPVCLPGLAASINPNIKIGEGAQHIYAISWLYGTFTAMAVYTVLSLVFPAKETFISQEEFDEQRAEFDAAAEVQHGADHESINSGSTDKEKTDVKAHAHAV